MEARHRLHQRPILGSLQHARARGRGSWWRSTRAGSNRRTSTCCNPTVSLPRRSSRGSNADYKALYNKVKDADLNSNPELLAEVEANFDIDNMFDYYIFESFYGNTDPGNIRFYRNTKSGDGKWRYLVFDMDWGLFNATYKSKGKEYATGCVTYYMNENGAGSQKIKSNLFVRKLVQVPAIPRKSS